MRTAYIKLISLGLLVASCSIARAGLIIETSIMDATPAEWTLGTTSLSYHPPCCGLSATAGTDLMHFYNGFSSNTGTNFIVFPSTLEPGSYTATIDAGNFDNRPLADVAQIGMTIGGIQPTSAGTFLTPSSSLVLSPALGATDQWSFDYVISPGDSGIGSNIGFAINVPFNGADKNIAFDNLQISFTPTAVPEPSAFLLSMITMVFLGWHRKRGSALPTS